MNYQSATTTQLYTIAYHEPCAPFMKLLAIQELNKRNKQAHSKVNARIKRKLNN